MKKIIALLAAGWIYSALYGTLTAAPPGSHHGIHSRFESYKGLVMAGYQGWFNAPDDGAGRGWNHYHAGGELGPGNCKFDLWPDVREYKQTYKTPFTHLDGSPAYLFSSYDASTTDLHFKWMEQYGLDGVFVQRFVGTVRSEKSLRHNNTVLAHALDASLRHNRAIAVMYDLSGMRDSVDIPLLIRDWKTLVDSLRLTNRGDRQTYLYHRGKPLVALWGVGFKGRNYTARSVERFMDFLQHDPEYGGCSILLGVPTYWRDLGNDADQDSVWMHLYRRADILQPWMVGRYNEKTYPPFQERIRADIGWCTANGLDYVPVVFPGFSWHNMYPKSPQNQIPRDSGRFYWEQITGDLRAGASMLYVAMFDEIDEGTAIFKISTDPPVGASAFVAFEPGLPSDYYLNLTGYAGRMLKGTLPLRDEVPTPDTFPATGLAARQRPMLKEEKPMLKEGFGQSSPAPGRIGRGECLVTEGVLRTKDAYAYFGDTAWRNYRFTFRAMAMPVMASQAIPADGAQGKGEAPAGDGEVHICAGFRANNRDDRYILGLKGGSFNALYLERMGFMGTDDYLALRPLAFPVRTGQWYRFRVEVAGDRIRIFLGDETLPRIDIRDPNAALCPNGQVTLGGSYLTTVYDDLEISPLKENALDGQMKEEPLPIPDREKLRRTERAAYQPLRLAALTGARTELSLDGNWLFSPGYEVRDNNDAILPSKDDRSWHVMHVPDFWNPSRVWLHGEKYKSESKGASDKYYQQEIDRCQGYSFDYTRTNIGWYRQWIELPAGVQGRHMELSFDAVSKVAEVWVNGRKAGSHIGMFGDFSLDVSALLHPGRNLVAVKVLRNYVNDIKDADKIADVAVTVEVTQRMIKDLPHGFFVDDPAGIWQPVKLTVTDPLHISDVFVEPGLSGASFEVTVRNDGTEDRAFALHTGIATLYKGASVSSVLLKAGQRRTLTYSVSGLHPLLWSPEDPHLYSFCFSIVPAAPAGDTHAASGAAASDSVCIRSGFRTFESKNGFFYLNGRRYWLRGANQTAMPLGPNNARLADRFCLLMHAAHINATRTHTVPFTETWMDAADRDGLGVSYEGTWPWLMIQGTMPDSSLLALWEQEWLDLLKKYRNHPSLLLWTVNNEMKFYDNDPDFERAKTKMRIISGVVRNMRKTDPTRPVVFDSNYRRNKKKFGEGFFQEVDDGDADDIHMYPNWYDNSIFDQFKGEFQTKFKNEGRPLISQEMSTGYSNNETGHPVRFYTFVHQTPQALVGKYAYDYSDPALFLHTHAFITRELAEAFRRTDDQASGILHFASITWFRYVYSADSIQPYPVYYSMQKALQPLLVSAELWGRHFYDGTHLPVRVCIVNDQDDTILSTPSTLHWDLETPAGSVIAAGTMPVDTVGYYGRRWLSPDILIPTGAGRQDAKLVLRLMRGSTLLSSNDYDIVLATRSWATQRAPSISVVDFGGRLPGLLDTLGMQHKDYTSLEAALAAAGAPNARGPLILSGLNPGNTSLDGLAKIRAFVSGGGKVLLLNPGTMATFLYPQYIKGVLDTKGEIMNMDIPESSVFDGLEPLDLRYFNNDRRESPVVCAGSFQVIRQANLSAPASFTRVHGYLQGGIEQRKAALEKLRGFPIVRIDDKGSIILSQVLLDKAATDPVAGRLLTNMIGALK